MLKFEFTEADKEALNHEGYYHPHPHVRRKMEAVWLKSQGLSHAEIGRLASISGPTLSQYLKEYQQGGLEQLKQRHFYQPESALVAYTDLLKSHFEAHPPATIKEAQAKIEELTGLKRSQTQIRAGFHALNDSMHTLASGYRERQMSAYVELQEAEFAAEKHGYTATKHQREVGAGYFDDVTQTVTGGHSSITAMRGSTEEAQFKAR